MQHIRYDPEKIIFKTLRPGKDGRKEICVKFAESVEKWYRKNGDKSDSEEETLAAISELSDPRNFETDLIVARHNKTLLGVMTVKTERGCVYKDLHINTTAVHPGAPGVRQLLLENAVFMMSKKNLERVKGDYIVGSHEHHHCLSSGMKQGRTVGYTWSGHELVELTLDPRESSEWRQNEDGTWKCSYTPKD